MYNFISLPKNRGTRHPFGDTFYLYATSEVGDLKSDFSFSENPVVWKMDQP
jgi:hypothetical protein